MSTLSQVVGAIISTAIIAAIIQYALFGIEGTLDLLFDKRIIKNHEGGPYLNRWFIIRTRRFALFLHKFVRSDYDRALHDHPWNFLVIPIWRGYTEHNERLRECNICGGLGAFTQRLREEKIFCAGCNGTGHRMLPNRTRVYPLIGTRYRRAEYKHRVELFEEPPSWVKGNGVECSPSYKPSWSLFFRFTKRRHWGFWCPKGWVPHQDGVSDHCNS